MDLVSKNGPVVPDSEPESGLGTSASSAETSDPSASVASTVSDVSVQLPKPEAGAVVLIDSRDGVSIVESNTSGVGSISILAGPPGSPRSISLHR